MQIKRKPISTRDRLLKLKSDIICGVYAVSVYMNLEMKVRSGGISGVTRKGDKLTCRNPIANRDYVFTIVSITGFNSVTVIDGYVITIVRRITRLNNGSRFNGDNRSSYRNADIDTLMVSSVTPI